MNSWYGMLAPAATPREIVNRLQQTIAAIITTPEMVQLLQARGFTTDGSTPDQFAARIRDDLAQWRRVVKAAGIEGTN